MIRLSFLIRPRSSAQIFHKHLILLFYIQHLQFDPAVSFSLRTIRKYCFRLINPIQQILRLVPCASCRCFGWWHIKCWNKPHIFRGNYRPIHVWRHIWARLKPKTRQKEVQSSKLQPTQMQLPSIVAAGPNISYNNVSSLQAAIRSWSVSTYPRPSPQLVSLTWARSMYWINPWGFPIFWPPSQLHW